MSEPAYSIERLRPRAADLPRPRQSTPIELRWHGDADPNADRAWLIREMIGETGKGLLAGQWAAARPSAPSISAHP